MDGLRIVESEVTPMNCPDVETSVKHRTTKPKWTVGKGKSRRQSKEDILAEENIVRDSNFRTMKSLMIKGGSGE